MNQRERIRAVQKMQDYIEAHLYEPITLHQLAICAGYSPWYCSKMFKEFTNKTPFEYIRMYRLSKAALKLRDDDPKIIDVAMDFVFDSHEGFTRAFQKQFGISPQHYKTSTPPLYLFHPWPITDRRCNPDGPGMECAPLSGTFTVQVRNFPKRKLLLKSGRAAADYFTYCEEVGCDVWGLLCSVKEALYEPAGLWLPDALRAENTSRYVQGVEVPADYRGVVPEGFSVIDLCACQMMLFQGEPYEDSRFEEAIAGLSEAMDRFDPRTRGFEWADQIAPRFQLDPQGWRGYIEARPVRALLP